MSDCRRLSLTSRTTLAVVQFLEQLAGEVEGKWPLLAASLSLTDSEIEQVKREGLPQKDHALQMLM